MQTPDMFTGNYWIDIKLYYYGTGESATSRVYFQAKNLADYQAQYKRHIKQFDGIAEIVGVSYPNTFSMVVH